MFKRQSQKRRSSTSQDSPGALVKKLHSVYFISHFGKAYGIAGRAEKSPLKSHKILSPLFFLYLDKNNMPMVALHWEKYFQHILKKYNSIYKVQMPKVTPHVCRHTFCSKMAKSGMNPKSLQYIMGHADISVTLNTYTHVKFEDAEAEMKRVAAI